MRFNEFNERILDEVRMSPTTLSQMAAKANATAGIEFEMFVPNATIEDDDGEMEQDYDEDQRTGSFSDIESFFYDGDWNGRRDVQRLMERLQMEFNEWLADKEIDAWNSDGKEFFQDEIEGEFDVREAIEQAKLDAEEYGTDDLTPEKYEKLISRIVQRKKEDWLDQEWNDEGSDYQRIRDEFRENFFDDPPFDDQDFLRDMGYRYMSDIEGMADISWPYWRPSGGDGGEYDVATIAQDFEQAIQRPVTTGGYHSGASRQTDNYRIESDSSLHPDDHDDAGLEFISPPLPLNDMISDLDKVVKWAKGRGCYTNSSTGLHMNVSIPGYSRRNLDFVKTVLFLGDRYILEQFNRESNTYCASALGTIEAVVKHSPQRIEQMMDRMRTNLNDLASRILHDAQTNKYTSINVHDNWIEFRSPGGDWLDEDLPKLKDTLLRCVVALDIGCHPDKFKQEYGKKLYQFLDKNTKTGTPNVIQLFANYSAGELDRDMLGYYIKKIQGERTAAKQSTTQPTDTSGEERWWKVESGPHSQIVMATSREQALAIAADEWGVSTSHPMMGVAAAYPLRPPQTAGSTRYEVYAIDAPNTALTTFYARAGDEAGSEQQFVNAVHRLVGANADVSRFAYRREL